RVLVLSPTPATMAMGLDRELDGLRDGGSTVLVIAADDRALSRFGDNPLDPSRRAPALEEGRRQGVAAASAVRALWQGNDGPPARTPA
ncbi:MAG TPA: hypothetical protein VG205_10775, partial [Acidimicrobiales bacterium]|nr:hypothetical protein [Acidimicrobiales bacterium]